MNYWTLGIICFQLLHICDVRDFHAMKVLRLVTQFSDVVGYQHFGAPYCLHFQGEATHYITTWHHNPEDRDLYLTVVRSPGRRKKNHFVLQCPNRVLLAAVAPHAASIGVTHTDCFCRERYVLCVSLLCITCN
jgi:hypothetical protein